MADTYDIVTIQPRTRSDGGNVFRRVQEVTFRTKPSGIVGTLDVADADLSPDAVDELVKARAALLEQVKAL